MRNLTAVTSSGLRSSDRRQAKAVDQLEPGFGLELEFHRLRRLEVVIDGDGEGNLVVLGQADGQVDVDEEVLEDA